MSIHPAFASQTNFIESSLEALKAIIPENGEEASGIHEGVVHLKDRKLVVLKTTKGDFTVTEIYEGFLAQFYSRFEERARVAPFSTRIKVEADMKRIFDLPGYETVHQFALKSIVTVLKANDQKGAVKGDMVITTFSKTRPPFLPNSSSLYEHADEALEDKVGAFARKLYQNQSSPLLDLTVAFDSGSLKCSKLLFASQSEIFAKSLEGGFSEASSGTFKLPYSSDVGEIFLNFLHRENSNELPALTNIEEAIAFLDLGNQYMMLDVTRTAINALMKDFLTPSNITDYKERLTPYLAEITDDDRARSYDAAAENPDHRRLYFLKELEERIRLLELFKPAGAPSGGAGSAC